MATQLNLADTGKISAPVLNSEWEDFGLRYDQYYSQLDKTIRNTIQQALSDWQDYYYGPAMDEWKQKDVDKWSLNLVKAKDLLNASIKAANAKPIAPPTSKPSDKPKVLPTLYITGKVPKTEPVIPPPNPPAPSPIPKMSMKQLWTWIGMGITTALGAALSKK